MCKEELNQIEDIEEVENKTIEDMSQEELVEVVYQLMDMKEKEIEVYTENVKDLEIDQEEFKAGIDSVSFMCGQFNALVSSGIDKASAIDILLNERNIDYNLQLNQMTSDNNKEIARIQQVQQEQNSI